MGSCVSGWRDGSQPRPHRRVCPFDHLPSVLGWKAYVEAGGLMSYGPNLENSWRQIAGLVGKILKGSRPADLPVELPTRFELIVNLKTARALGLTVPPILLAGTDQVIE